MGMGMGRAGLGLEVGEGHGGEEEGQGGVVWLDLSELCIAAHKINILVAYDPLPIALPSDHLVLWEVAHVKPLALKIDLHGLLCPKNSTHTAHQKIGEWSTHGKFFFFFLWVACECVRVWANHNQECESSPRTVADV